MTRTRALVLGLGLAFIAVALSYLWYRWTGGGEVRQPAVFDSERAFSDLETQLAMGPRVPGAPGHAAFQEWLSEELSRAGWVVEFHNTEMQGYPVENVVAFRAPLETTRPWVILGAHYDTRPVADRDPDPDQRGEPVPGANDGASGVSVLLELARVLPENLNAQVWLVFFDAEDGGDVEGAPWILGSRAFVRDLPVWSGERKPDQVVVIDMIGDRDLNIHVEMNSDPGLSAGIWQAAQDLGYGNVFLPFPKYSMLDDHTPFLQAGIRSALLIDFDYAYWHTTADTADKTSAESLQAVGEVLLNWIALQSHVQDRD